MATDYFKGMFTADPNISPDRVTRLIQQRITDEMNDKLCVGFTDEEIAMAVFRLDP